MVSNKPGIQIDIPGKKPVKLTHAVFDFNGTLAKSGQPLPSVLENLTQLSNQLEIFVATADTFGSVKDTLKDLPVKIQIVSTGSDKAQLVRSLGAEKVIAIGNGNNDVEMFKIAGLSIAILGPEGLASSLISECSLLVSRIDDAFYLLHHPENIKATLRP